MAAHLVDISQWNSSEILVAKKKLFKKSHKNWWTSLKNSTESGNEWTQETKNCQVQILQSLRVSHIVILSIQHQKSKPKELKDLSYNEAYRIFVSNENGLLQWLDVDFKEF